MKRILAIAAALVMIFVLTVPALAADAAPSVTADDLVIKITSSSEKPSDADIGSGNKLLGVYDASLVHSSTGAAATAEEVAAYIAAKGGSIVVDFSSVVGSANPVKVLHKMGASWQSESFSGSKVTVSSLSPFAFIVKADANNGGNNNGGNNNGGNSNAGGNKASPQTGYNTVMWTIAAAAMVVGAGYCFVSARKKVTE